MIEKNKEYKKPASRVIEVDGTTAFAGSDDNGGSASATVGGFTWGAPEPRTQLWGKDE